MKRYKILTVAMAAAVMGGASAMAQFDYQNGDLIAAFGTGTATDVLVDLGPISSFQAGTPNSWNLDTVLTSVFGSTPVGSSLYWSVFGVNDTTLSPYNSSITQASPYTVWSTLARANPDVQNPTPNVSGNANSQHLAVNAIETIVDEANDPGSNPGSVTDYSPGIELVSPTLGGGYTSQMNPDGNLSGTWSGNMLNDGVGTSDFYQNDPGNPIFTSADYLGNFSLDSGGTLTFNPVPEPSTWAMVGSGFLALIALRRRK
jgi:hypothetical protein